MHLFHDALVSFAERRVIQMKRVKRLIKKTTLAFCVSLMAFGTVPFTAFAKDPESAVPESESPALDAPESETPALDAPESEALESEASAADTPASEDTNIPSKDVNLQWVYKTVKRRQTIRIKGKKKRKKRVTKKIRYKRLYNFTQREWVSGWIRIK